MGHMKRITDRTALYPFYLTWRALRARSSSSLSRVESSFTHKSLNSQRQLELIRTLGVVMRIMGILGSTYRPELAQFRDVLIATTEFDEFYYLSVTATDSVTPSALPQLGCPELPDCNKGVVIPSFCPYWLFAHLVVTYAKIASWVAVSDEHGMAVVTFTSDPDKMPEGTVIEI